MEFLRVSEQPHYRDLYLNCGGVNLLLRKREMDYQDERQHLAQIYPTHFQPDGKLALTLLLVGNTPVHLKSQFPAKKYFALVLQESAAKIGCFERIWIAEATFEWEVDRFETTDAAYELGVEVTKRETVVSETLRSKGKFSDSHSGENKAVLEPTRGVESKERTSCQTPLRSSTCELQL
jgi:hypothetical protein